VVKIFDHLKKKHKKNVGFPSDVEKHGIFAEKLIYGHSKI